MWFTQVSLRNPVFATMVMLALSPAGAPAQVLRLVLLRGIAVSSEAMFAEWEPSRWKPWFKCHLRPAALKGILRDARALGGDSK
jgi:hypothetical protein